MDTNYFEEFKTNLVFSYIIPWLLVSSMMILIEGNATLTVIGIYYQGFHARAIGFLSLIIGLGLLYGTYIKVMKELSKESRKKYINYITKTHFLYLLCLLVFIFPFVHYIFHFPVIYRLVFILIVCYFQWKFNKGFVKLVDSDIMDK
jgi:hypothetical protein